MTTFVNDATTWVWAIPLTCVVLVLKFGRKR